MKNSFIFRIMLLLILLNPAVSMAGENTYTYELEFGDPGSKKILQIGGNGDLNITGYTGNKILISANESVFEEDEEVNEKAKGLKKLGGGGFNIINNKKENHIIISRPITGMNTDLTIKVPNDIILRLGSGGSINKQDIRRQAKELRKEIEKFNSTGKSPQEIYIRRESPIAISYMPAGASGIIQGNILIKDFTGAIEVNTIQGDINIENIRGEVTASSVQGNINIIFNKLNKENALYFSTVNGEIDITLPKETAADIISKTLNGNVYSGFDGEISTEKVVNNGKAETGSQNYVSNIIHSNYITSKINGGGQEIYLSTINGNIYIRKGV